MNSFLQVQCLQINVARAVLVGTSSLVRFAFDHNVLNEVLQ